MGCSTRIGLILVAMLAAAADRSAGQPLHGGLSEQELARADSVIRTAFAFLYALPSDTAAVGMGSWVLDSAATTPPSGRTRQWRIVVTKLTDTGRDLTQEEMTGAPGTSPAQLAAAMAAMQRLEAKISKAEADASLEVVVALNPVGASSVPEKGTAAQVGRGIPGAQLSRHVPGHWTHIEDRQLGITAERWQPATLLVWLQADRGPGLQTVVVTAQGSDEMIERVAKETRWDALAMLVK